MSNKIVRLVALVVLGGLIGFALMKVNQKVPLPPLPPLPEAAAPAATPPSPDTATAAPLVAPEMPIPPVATTAAPSVTGAFSLIDHNGAMVTSTSYSNTYKLVFFGFTHCPDVCPTTLQKIATVMAALGSGAEQIQPLFITVDPVRDTPSVMKDYVSTFSPRLIGLTGTQAQVDDAVKNYKAYASKAPAPMPGMPVVDMPSVKEGMDMAATPHAGEAHNEMGVDHSSFIYLMGKDDSLLQVIDAQTSVDEMVNTIRTAAGIPADAPPAIDVPTVPAVAPQPPVPHAP